jgi:putative solute:sodium symporter small subunit
MQLTEKQVTYWRKTRALTIALLAVWFLVTFVGGYFAVTLNGVEVFGFPLGFYLFAQGALVIYLLIIGIYVTVMNRLDRSYGVAERR